jgi:hypothetical protein
MKIKTYLPIFSGFYSSIWEIDYSYIEQFIQDERNQKGIYSNYNVNDIRINNEQYKNDIVELFCQSLSDIMSDFINGIELERIISPKSYNFSNDSADVIIDIKTDEIKSFIYLHKEKFCEFLKKRYTSYDGFISHYKNDFESWENDTKGFSDFSINGHILGSILDFIANEINVNEMAIYENISENLYILEYVENLDEIINQSDNSLFEFLTMNNYSKSYADYIESCYNNDTINSLSLDEKTLSIIREFKIKRS